MAEGADVLPRVVRQITVHQTRFEDEMKGIHLERESLDKEKELQAQVVADLKA
jgi:hypothetical protein